MDANLKEDQIGAIGTQEDDLLATKSKEAHDVNKITKHMQNVSIEYGETKEFGDTKIENSKDLMENLPAICNEIFEILGQQNLEATYQSALCEELQRRGVIVASEVDIPIKYKGLQIATRRIDLLLYLEKPVILELKAVTGNLLPTHLMQLQYYMTHSRVEEGYLINFPHITGFPAPSNGIVYKQTVLQPENGPTVSDCVTRSSTGKKDVKPVVIRVTKVDASKT
ncbi:hypothetical protein THRCLA_20807 [Thraustotheca clavata]|uniref:GxxExxY protein n=1 Tax=Thraustotheca clavata TaxID=74557 RepID=A0A1W0A3A4_9STRA|nr:hypothetical protein THRCLA_20807 [Thraustotheca clavata]